jgi:PAS domain S-box-containing protein
MDWFRTYERFIKNRLIDKLSPEESSLDYWQDKLFLKLLVYCLPLSFIAAIPGIYLSFKTGYTGIGEVDIVSVLALAFITLSRSISLNVRKVLFLCLFYVLSVFLISNLGYVGPGVFYLFAITVLCAIILPATFAYWTIVANVIFLLFFAIVIQYKLFGSVLGNQYSTGEWLAYSSNLVFLSIVVVVLIQKILRSLRLIITNKDQLQEQYKNIFDKSPLPMWLFDTDTLFFLDVNDAAVRHYGYTKDEFLGMTLKDIRSAENIRQVEAVVKKNKQSGIFYDGHAQHIKKNGEYIFVKIESNMLYYNNRRARLVLATDVTEQLRNELEIYNANLKVAESEANLKAVFESSTDGFVLIDTDYRIKILNAKARQYMRFNKNHVEIEAGKNIFEFVEPSRRSYFEDVVKKVITGEVVDYDRRHTNDEGLTYWIRYTLTPVYEGHKVTGLCITGRDITSRRLYLKAVEDQNKTFRKISWMQSHMVRAPLARIMGLLSLLKNNAATENDEIIKYLTISANELDDIIRNITIESNQIIEKYPSVSKKAS